MGQYLRWVTRRLKTRLSLIKLKKMHQLLTGKPSRTRNLRVKLAASRPRTQSHRCRANLAALGPTSNLQLAKGSQHLSRVMRVWLQPCSCRRIAGHLRYLLSLSLTRSRIASLGWSSQENLVAKSSTSASRSLAFSRLYTRMISLWCATWSSTRTWKRFKGKKRRRDFFFDFVFKFTQFIGRDAYLHVFASYTTRKLELTN